MENEAFKEDSPLTLLCPPKAEVAEPVDREELAQEAHERAKQQPILQRIIKSFTKNDKKFREVILSREGLETHVISLVDGVLESIEVEHAQEQNLVGAIFKGKIQNLEPGLKAAFVITGQEKNAFLHYWDMLPAANDAFEIISSGEKKESISLEDIPQMYPIGSDILVQVTKAQIGSKGPRTTTNISIPGRFMVLTPFNDQCGISRKIADPKERERLKEILHQLVVPKGMGVIIRTVGEGKKLKHFIRDLSILLKEWDEIEKKAQKAKEPCMVYHEPDLIGRSIRDFLTTEVDRIVTDSSEIFARIVHEINEFAPRMRSRVHLYEGSEPIFQHFNVESQIQEIFSKRVALPSGGEIVIEETEALIAIDVNTGGHRNQEEESKDGKNFILQVNMEAAAEIARQVRLRNLGGLIIVDFIDMKSRADQRALYDRMNELLEKDNAKFQVLPISAMGIMQITRQRHSQSLARDMRIPCPYCSGCGTIKSARTIDAEIQRTLIHIIKDLRQTRKEILQLKISVHPRVLQLMKHQTCSSLESIERDFDVSLHFYGEPTLHMEDFKIFDMATHLELR